MNSTHQYMEPVQPFLIYAEHLEDLRRCVEMPSLRYPSDSGSGQLRNFGSNKTFSAHGTIVTAAATLDKCLISQLSCAQIPDHGLVNSARDRRASNHSHISKSSPANTAPVEILHQIFFMLSPHDFDNARRTCSQWMTASLNRRLLENMLKDAGWWDAFLRDVRDPREGCLSAYHESHVWKMSRRLATECLLSGQRTAVSRSRFHRSAVIDFSNLPRGSFKTRRISPRHVISSDIARSHLDARSTFKVGNCNNHVLVTAGCTIYLYRLLHGRKGLSLSPKTKSQDLELISRIECPSEVLLATMDTRPSHIAVAALLQNRCSMICTVDSSAGSEATNHRECKPAERRQAHSATRFFSNLCSEDHPPRTVALLPGRQCVAFGCAGGVEIHWLDEKTGGTQCRRLPMSQPSEILHFLPSSNNDPAEFRLISSLAGPGPHECSCRQSPVPDHSQTCPFRILSNKNLLGGRTQYSTSSLSLVRATHCHNYRTVPINDGLHMIFVDPRTGNLSIGSNSPIGGPASLTRGFVCVPPLTNDPNNNVKEGISPAAFAVGSDLDWGLRVVAAYQDRLILYSIPADIYNVIRKERERQNGDFMGDGVIPHSWLTDSERIHKHCDNLVRDQNCDLEVALSVSYPSTSMVWPFKVYGKEIGRVDDVVEVALQTSNGGARAWAFAASGQAHVFDIDTVSTTAKLMSRAPVSTCVVNSKGEIVPSAVQACAPSGTQTQPQLKTRKRKRTEPHNTWTGQSAKARFASGANLTSAGTADHPSPASMHPQDTSTKRSSFAACIFDFKIPNLSLSDGVWVV